MSGTLKLEANLAEIKGEFVKSILETWTFVAFGNRVLWLNELLNGLKVALI